MHLFKRHDTEYNLIAKSKYFNKRWYLKTYPDVAAAGIDPVQHYIDFGWKEGRNPSSKFDTNAYLNNSPDVKQADINPLLHYEQHGKQEGRFVYDSQATTQKIIPQKYKNKIGVIYTCITGDYDGLIKHQCINNNFDYVCFTDNKTLLNKKNISGWDIKPLKYNKKDKIRNARWHKVHPEKLFPNYDFSIWIDGNLDVLNEKLFQKFDNFKKKHAIIWTYKHPLHDCVYDEADLCLKLKKDFPEVIHKQVDFLRSEKYPEHNGAAETGIVIRNHSNKQYAKIADTWWNMISKFSRRDQLGFGYALWKHGLDISNVLQGTDTICTECGIGKVLHESKSGKIAQFEPVEKLSIIIPVYNALDEVKSLFDSILNSELTDATEIIVVNDASKQETTNFLRDFSAKHPRFQLLENQKNLGFVGTCNRGMKAASGDVVILLNSDTIIPKSFEKKIIYFFNKKKNTGLASPISTDTGLWKIPMPETWTIDDMDKLVESLSKKEFPEMLCPEGFCICIRKQVLTEVGYLDEIYGRGYCEETDLDLRALNNGWELRLIDNLFVAHKHHVSFGSKLRDEQIAKNSKILWSRWRPLYDRYAKKINTLEMIRKKTDQILKHIQTTTVDENKNSVTIGHNINLNISISGRKNVVVVKSAELPSILSISITGNNNTIYIDNSNRIKELKIAIGSLDIVKINNTSVKIGSGFSCGASQLFVYNDNSVVNIGKDNLWSWDIVLRSGERPHLLFDYKTGKCLNRPGNVQIGDHVWIGQNVGIMSHAQIPSYSVIGAFSVVTRKFTMEHTMIAGNPATVKKKNIHFEKNRTKISDPRYKI
ncbi:MAG: glycosyltransferase [Alphaproteobacteria bacterium]